MRKNTHPAGAPRGFAFRAARVGVAAASAVVVTASGLGVTAPASAVTTVPTLTSPAPTSTIYSQNPVFAGTAAPSRSVTVTLTQIRDGKRYTYCTTRSDAAGRWSCTGATLPLGVYTVQLTAGAKSPEYHFVIDDIDSAFPFAIVAPAFGQTVETHRPVFEGTGRPASVVIVHEGETVLGSAVAGDDGTWSIESEIDLANGPHAIRFDYYRTADNPTPVHYYINVNVPVEVAPVTFDAPEANSTVTEANPVFSGAGEAGATVVVTDGGGAELASTTVGADGTWSATSTVGLTNGTHTATATQTVAGAAGSTTASTTFTVSIVAASLVVTSPAIDEVVDTSRPVFAGTGEPGASITVTGSSGKVLAATTVDGSGTWSVVSDIELGNDHYVGTVTQDIPGGAQTRVAVSYSVKTVEAREFTVVSPAPGAVLGTDTPVFTGVGTPGATVQIRGNSGRVIASATVDAEGAWSATSQLQLTAGRYIASATHTDANGTTRVGLDYTIAKALVVTSPAVGADATGPRPVYSGTGQAGATVEIKGTSGRTVASAVVDANGNWTTTADFDLTIGRYAGTAVQSIEGVHLGTVAMEYIVR